MSEDDQLLDIRKQLIRWGSEYSVFETDENGYPRNRLQRAYLELLWQVDEARRALKALKRY